VAVGSELYSSTKWKTFPDFLWDYMIRTLTPPWGKEELAKPYESRHILLQWFDRACKVQSQYAANKSENGIYGLVPDGATAAYLLLAYDLYLLRHHQALQDDVVRRLKRMDQFQGARYELFVAATCIRAGFTIQHEDEQDLTRRHMEFLATHAATAQKIWIEAKSMHRPGILGQPTREGTEATIRHKAGRLLRDAAAKDPPGACVVFVDVNVPSDSEAKLEGTWRQDAVDAYNALSGDSADGLHPINMALFTNHPFHYGDESAFEKWKDTVVAMAATPRHELADRSVLQALAEATKLYGAIPQTFEEAE